MLRSKFFKSIFIILVVLIIGGGGYIVWKKNTDIKKIEKEEFVCSFKDEFKCEVEELVTGVVQASTTSFHMSFADPLPGQEPWYASENKLVKLGEKAVPVLIEIIEENRTKTYTDNRHHAIYILGHIGGEEAVDVLVGIIKSREENIDDRCYAAQALGKNKKNPKALKALEFIASTKQGGFGLQHWVREALGGTYKIEL